MAKIIIQAIKMAPRFLWQIYVRPSNVYDFVIKGKEYKENIFISTVAFFFSGLLVGIVLAIPHYFFHHDLLGSLIFASEFGVAFSFAFAFAVAALGAAAAANENESAVAGAVAVAAAVAAAFVVADAFNASAPVAAVIAGVFAVVSLFACLFSFIGALVFAVAVPGFLKAAQSFIAQPSVKLILVLLGTLFLILVYLVFKGKIKKKSGHTLVAISFALFAAFLFLAGQGGGRMVKSIEAFQFFFSFWWTYIIGMSFVFKAEKNLNENIQAQAEIGTLNKRYARFQKSAIFWGPSLTYVLYLASQGEKVAMKAPLFIIASGFLVIALLIAHVPDYIICLRKWFSERRKSVENPGKEGKLLHDFESSILFRHEPLYFQLPGLYRIITSFAENRRIGVKGAVKQIANIYRSTFQQKQMQKAVAVMAKNKELTHYLFLSLLELNALPLVSKLHKSNTLAEIYGNLSRRERHMSEAIQKLEKKKGYRFNEEMIKTLQAAHGFLTSQTLKDIETACMVMEEIKEFPTEIGYFAFFDKRMPQLSKVKDALLSIGSIEHNEIRRDLLSHQKRNLEVLHQDVHKELFEPFKDIWKRGLNNSIGIMEAEIELPQDLPSFSIELKNKSVFVSAEVQNLYFEVHNKRNELVFDVSINSLEVVEGPISLADTPRKKIAVIESNGVKEISVPITTKAIGKAIVKGTFTFSDRAGENDLIDFSFPVTVKERFKEIDNPYNVGRPLKGDAPYYFGRDDAYGFIDKNITASGDRHTIVCHGMPKTGKTSLLYHIESRGFTAKRLVPIYFDIQGIDNEKYLFISLSTEIREKLSLSPGAAVEDFDSFQQFIKEIKPELGERIIVLMIDEFEELQMRVEEGRISPTIFSNFRHLMQHEEKLVFLFCGTRKPEEMGTDYWPILFNTAIYLRISHLKPKAALRLIKEPVKGQLDYDDLAVEHILKMTAGQPYLVQLICRTLVNDLNENKKRNTVLMDDVDEAVEHIIANGQDRFSMGIWQESTLLERLALSSIAEELTLKQLEQTGADAVYERLQTVTPKFAGKDVQGALDKLAYRGILAEKDKRYSFPVDLLRKWISARCPLGKVREEIDFLI
ncbi:MAG: hypothetical protein PVH61_20920 [Candidatus Aminicenantes bacterium]|jgi:hypothetical protein